ncbi:MAG: thymidylate kinase [Patescibacteria group bacterium]|jgi:dTMP kinase
MSGKLIVIDGTDGSGKGTQTDLLIAKLKSEGFKVEKADFPRYGNRSATLVEEYLNGKFGSADEVGPYRASIFYACDRYAASFEIKNWLNEDKIVVSNRYVSANMGHQTGKIQDSTERDKFLDWVQNLEFNIFQIPKPDINVLLYMPPEIGQKLVDQKGVRDYIGGDRRDIHEDDLNHLKRAADAFAYVADKYNWININCAPNGNLLTIEEVHNLLWDKIKAEIKL